MQNRLEEDEDHEDNKMMKKKGEMVPSRSKH